MNGTRLINLAGQRFGSWTVLRLHPEPRFYPCGLPVRMWVCQCDCGTKALVMGGHLRAGNSTGCATCGHAKTATSAAARAPNAQRGVCSFCQRPTTRMPYECNACQRTALRNGRNKDGSPIAKIKRRVMGGAA